MTKHARTENRPENMPSLEVTAELMSKAAGVAGDIELPF